MPYYGRFGYVEIMLFLMTKLFLLCRLFSVVRTRFVRGVRYNKQSTNRYSRRCVRCWSKWLWRFLPNMDGSIISGSVHHLFRHRHSVGLWTLLLPNCRSFIFLFIRLLVLAMCILIMQRPGDTLNTLYPFDATF